MPLFNKIANTIHYIDDVDFNNYTYFYVYASNNTTVTINGTQVNLVAGTILPIQVSSIEGADVYLIGSPIVTTLGYGETVGSLSNTTTKPRVIDKIGDGIIGIIPIKP